MKHITASSLSKAAIVLLLIVVYVGATEKLSEIHTGYHAGDFDARNLRSELYKWDDFYVTARQEKDKAVSLAFDGYNMQANTRQEALRFFNHRLHCLAWSVTNQTMAVEFTNLVERYITNLPTGPE